eukprot:Gb_23204 [translate_table: standard]
MGSKTGYSTLESIGIHKTPPREEISFHHQPSRPRLGMGRFNARPDWRRRGLRARQSQGEQNYINELRMVEGATLVKDIMGLAKLYSDGSVVRAESPITPPSPHFVDGVASKDVVINSKTGVWARIFVPQTVSSGQKVPLIFYFHGGAFLFGSTAWSDVHTFLQILCQNANAVIVSVDYRLAPEHRLPTAYDDCAEAMEWVRRQAGGIEEIKKEEWVTSFVDFSRCFLAGESAGGNIVHNVGMRAAAMDLRPLAIKGLCVVHPFFGGEQRSPGIASQMRATGDEVKLLETSDLIWKLCLPDGSDRDHPACNPVVLPLAEVELGPVLVAVAGLDMLKYRGIVYFQHLQACGKEAQLMVEEGEGHAFHIISPNSQASQRLVQRISDFIRSH